MGSLSKNAENTVAKNALLNIIKWVLQIGVLLKCDTLNGCIFFDVLVSVFTVIKKFKPASGYGWIQSPYSFQLYGVDIWLGFAEMGQLQVHTDPRKRVMLL